MTLGRRLAAETLGTALLLAVVVGSGIMGENLAQGNNAIALLANTLATGAGLVVLILAFGPLSGAHFNPAVSLVECIGGSLPWRELPAYVAAQIAGAFSGVAAAHVMFEKPLFFASRHVREGGAQMWSEFVATGKLPKVEAIFHPTSRQALQGVGITKNELLINISDNVVVKVMAYRKGATGWTAKEVPLPPNGSAGVIFADNEEATAFLGFDGYLSPDSR